MKCNPYQLLAYDKAYKLKRGIEDERDWLLGRYFQSALISVVSGFTKDKQSYVEKPFLSDVVSTSTDPEANEKLAVAEMQCWIAQLKHDNRLPETILSDLKKETKT